MVWEWVGLGQGEGIVASLAQAWASSLWAAKALACSALDILAGRKYAGEWRGEIFGLLVAWFNNDAKKSISPKRSQMTWGRNRPGMSPVIWNVMVWGRVYFMITLLYYKKVIAKIQDGLFFGVHDHGMASPIQAFLYNEPLLHAGTNGKREFPCLLDIVHKQLVQASLG